MHALSLLYVKELKRMHYHCWWITFPLIYWKINFKVLFIKHAINTHLIFHEKEVDLKLKSDVGITEDYLSVEW